MARNTNQLTLFEDPPKPLPLFDAPAAPSYVEPSAENFRVLLHETLAMLQACAANPWSPADARFQGFLYRERTKWLPDDEGAPLRAAFQIEWDRLGIVQSELSR